MRRSCLAGLTILTLVGSSCGRPPPEEPSVPTGTNGTPDAGDTTTKVPEPELRPRCPLLEESQVWTAGTEELALPGDLGRVLGCAHLDTMTPEQLRATGYFGAWTPPSGVERFVIQYVSQGPVGKARRTTALVYAPAQSDRPLPIVVVNHGTSGVGPACGPTRAPGLTDYMALPLAGRGYAVVAPDYFGMGVSDGVSPYLVGEAEAFSALDGLRALRAFSEERFDPKKLSKQVFFMGHSQGGHAALFAHQLFDPSLDVELLGTIAFAPGLGSARGQNYILSSGTRATDGLTMFILLTLLGHAQYHGTVALTDFLTPAAADQIPAMVSGQCLTELLFRVPGAFPTQADLFSEAFRQNAATCAFDGRPCPDFEPWSTWISSSVAGSITSTAPVLLLQGLQDGTVAPASTACIRDRLAALGTPSQSCAYAATHLSIIEASMEDALAWMELRREGTLPNICKANLTTRCF